MSRVQKVPYGGKVHALLFVQRTNTPASLLLIVFLLHQSIRDCKGGESEMARKWNWSQRQRRLALLVFGSRGPTLFPSSLRSGRRKTFRRKRSRWAAELLTGSESSKALSSVTAFASFPFLAKWGHPLPRGRSRGRSMRRAPRSTCGARADCARRGQGVLGASRPRSAAFPTSSGSQAQRPPLFGVTVPG